MSAPFESLGKLLSSHRAVTRVALAALSFTLIFAVSQQTATTQAGPEPAPLVPETLLPQSVGTAIPTDHEIVIPFDAAMDTASVEASLELLPAQKYELSWSGDRSELTISPQRLWRTDERYLVIVAGSAEQEGGEPLVNARRFTFTTQTAPTVSDFQVRLVSADLDPVESQPAAGSFTIDPVVRSRPAGSQPPTETATDVSATSSISVSFSALMDRADVESRFAISPRIEGDLDWDGNNLVFSPSERLEPGSRYTISVIGAHDRAGNVLGGKGNFSFVVQPGAQLTRTTPDADATDVEPAAVELWFSAPMDEETSNDGFSVTHAETGTRIAGLLTWNDAGTQLVFRPDEPFAGGGTFEVAIDGARDIDGNVVDVAWSFTTKAPPVVEAAPEAEVPAEAQAPSRSTTSSRTAPAPAPAPAPATAPTPAPAPAPVVAPAGPATSLAGYALNQVNAARAAYGFPPVALDSGISAVASAHAWDQARNGYFSHTGLNGSTRESRLRAGGVSFGWSGENQCYRIGMSEQGTLDWCHQQFMAEPYPGHWNHIANILNPNARRMGVGIATVNGRTVVTWVFTN